MTEYRPKPGRVSSPSTHLELVVNAEPSRAYMLHLRGEPIIDIRFEGNLRSNVIGWSGNHWPEIDL